LKKAVCQIRTRSKATGEMVESDKACENCKEKFENDELPKCGCGRLKTRYTCDCKEEENEKELPLLPHQNGGMALFYEQQISGLQEKERQLEEEVDTHLEALEVAEDWHKRQKQELLDRIKQLEEENKQLKELTPQELLKEINDLKAQLTQLQQQNGQLTAQIEVKETKK
jgi:ribosomal protein L29